ncbi:TetR/AcrR family transcriptional regulator [Micromonospora parathelypteridis]|uniref:AcrR family transcriptional regulator n=1 Tax=Micromonospora parathelypteridis TaxID=1839617 RepID=A0A840VHB1_9ACTN|nr:TetR/AcrR family transcriptional regulator [Micromonospora parathelypteridis]MBB5476232.1 AcrR family transcriptional regulator [Micromonospora parathelypteridis]GGO14092.1 TetR family transcriptional regulator [Micromonospora parathelypteridis]
MPAATAAQEVMRGQLLDAAERVFYSRGIQAVNMNELRSAAELPLRRIYQLFPSKDDLVVAFLRRRHDRMMAAIEDYVAGAQPPQPRVLAIFDYLDEWFREPDFRGCPWMNAYGELGPTNPAIAAEVRHHQRAFRKLVTGIVTEAGYTVDVASVIYLLVEGSVATAAVQHAASPAGEARRGAEILLTSDPSPTRRVGTR